MKSIKIKKLTEFSKYFNPVSWRNWRNYTYYRIFADYFLVIER